MKKRIQKYLSGSNEGFSLVELIIVIAIMAILVGVVALAVIPYLEKSRESKDLQALDTIASALTTAVADVKATGTQSFTINSAGSFDSNSAAAKVITNMQSTLGDSTLTLNSNGGSGKSIECYYNTTNNKVVVYVRMDSSTEPSGVAATAAYSGGPNVQHCRYNDNAPLMVSN